MPFKEHTILAGAVIGLVSGVITCLTFIDQIASKSASASFIIIYMAAIIFLSTLIGSAFARMLYATLVIVLDTLKASGIFTRKKQSRGKQ